MAVMPGYSNLSTLWHVWGGGGGVIGTLCAYSASVLGIEEALSSICHRHGLETRSADGVDRCFSTVSHIPVSSGAQCRIC